MKITVNRKMFVDSLGIGTSMSGKSKVLSILDNAKIRFKGSVMYCTSNSTQSCITHRSVVGVCDTPTDLDIEFLVNPNDLLKAVKSLRDNEITLELLSNTLIISHKRGTMEMPTLDCAEFPMMEKVESANVYVFNSERLFNWLSIARDFASADELRPVMCGMLLYVKDGKIGACATDTRILFADSYEAETTENIECVIPTSAFSVLQSVLNGTETVEVTLNEKNVSFKTSDSRLTCQLQVGRFPDFNRVIPQNNGIEVTMGREDLLDAVNRVSLFADKSHSLVKMNVSGMSCRFSATDAMSGKGADDECMCEHVGDDIKIGINGEMFLKCVNHNVGSDVTMTFNQPSNPILFKDKANDSFVMLLMPMNIE